MPPPTDFKTSAVVVKARAFTRACYHQLMGRARATSPMIARSRTSPSASGRLLAATVLNDVRAAVARALDCECEAGDTLGDLPDFYYPDAESEVSLCVELLGNVLSITRISCWPQGRGLGKRVVGAILEVAATKGLALDAPDPFETSLPFWQSLGARDIGVGERTILRLQEPRS